MKHSVGRVLIVWFNDCILGKSGQIANPIIATSTLYCIIVYAHVYVCECIINFANVGKTNNSQLIDTRN